MRAFNITPIRNTTLNLVVTSAPVCDVMAAPAARPWPWAVFDYIGEASPLSQGPFNAQKLSEPLMISEP